MPKTKAEQRNQDQLVEIARLKDDYIRYFEAAPIYRMAAYSIGRDEDTLLTWRKADPEFAERIRRAKATWALKKIQATRDTKFLLERILKEDFAQKVELASNQPASISFTYVLPPDSHQPNPEATPGVAEVPGQDH